MLSIRPWSFDRKRSASDGAIAEEVLQEHRRDIRRIAPLGSGRHTQPSGEDKGWFSTSWNFAGSVGLMSCEITNRDESNSLAPMASRYSSTADASMMTLPPPAQCQVRRPRGSGVGAKRRTLTTPSTAPSSRRVMAGRQHADNNRRELHDILERRTDAPTRPKSASTAAPDRRPYAVLIKACSRDVSDPLGRAWDKSTGKEGGRSRPSCCPEPRSRTAQSAARSASDRSRYTT